MPLFKRIDDTKSDPDTYLFDTNPNPDMYEPVDPPASTKADKADSSKDK